MIRRVEPIQPIHKDPAKGKGSSSIPKTTTRQDKTNVRSFHNILKEMLNNDKS
jgi:hypothetical protein